MSKSRTAYFRTHRGAAARKAFVKRQQAKLKALQVAAACTVPSPPPSPPADTTPPAVEDAVVDGAILTLTYNEALAAAPQPSAFAVTVSGLAWRVTAVALAGERALALTLAPAVPAGAAVVLSYTPPSTGAAVGDRIGNRAAALTAQAVANKTVPSTGSTGSFAPSLAKPSFADDRSSSTQPWVGQWGPKTDPYWLPPTGTLRGLIVPVDFVDAQASRTVEFYRSYLEPEAESYYREASYGRLNLDLTTFPRWVRMARPGGEYGLQNCCPQDRLKAFLEELTTRIDGEVDFSQVDAIFAVAPESAGQFMSILLYRAWPAEGFIHDGRELRWGVVGNGGLDPREAWPLLPHHMITHELGHLLGLADLYDVRFRNDRANQFAWAGAWDLMSDNRKSGHLFAWNKWLLGWLDATQLRGITAPGVLEETITPLELPGGVKAVVVPNDPNRAYVIEVRQRIGFDARLCDKGVLVWLVDGSKRNVEENAVVQAARRSFSEACGAIYDAAYDLGDGEISIFEDAAIRMDVLTANPDGSYRVRVTRK